MPIVYNGAHKRVCDISLDGRTVIIRIHGFVTLIWANPDGTLHIENVSEQQ